MNQEEQPIVQALHQYIEDGALAFHTPGHKQGLGASEDLRQLITPLGLRMEVSLMDELEDIHSSFGCVYDAQKLMAELYGSKSAFFFINGTSGAIHAMLMAALQPGDSIILPRNAHRSVLGGLTLVGAKPIFIQPAIDEFWGIATNPTVAETARIITEHPEAKAILLTYPNYYGIASDIVEIIKLAHKHNLIVLVDEAHGPHFAFSANLPISAIAAGADVVAQSTHKILGSLTQTSVLHLQGERVSQEHLATICSLLQSTSPNYLLMASLDTARHQMATQGQKLIQQAIELAHNLRANLNALPGIKCFSSSNLNGQDKFALDHTKIMVSVRGLNRSAYEVNAILRHKFKIQAELVDCYNILLIISYADTTEQINRLLHAFTEISALLYPGPQQNYQVNYQTVLPIPPMKYIPRQALYAPATTVKFADSIGKVSAEMITLYPPGIPLIYPGEIITEELYNSLLEAQALGANIKGPSDSSLQTINIIT